jgi:methionine-rich copper-binding protein CopC
MRNQLVVCALLGALVAATVSSPGGAAAARRHARLVKSAPAANDTLAASPSALKLWFSEKVELSVVRAKLVGPGDATVRTGKPARIPGEGEEAFMVAVPAALAPGKYVVQWTAPAEDGHPSKGAFSFVILARP